jgi:organic hydroperoxide reductase OsmC/OhrA
MLWYLHLCAEAKIVVLEYIDQAQGVMVETADGGGHFKEVVLRPAVTIKQGGDAAVAQRLHERAHHLCFIANSVNFSVRCDSSIRVREKMEQEAQQPPGAAFGGGSGRGVQAAQPE